MNKADNIEIIRQLVERYYSGTATPDGGRRYNRLLQAERCRQPARRSQSRRNDIH